MNKVNNRPAKKHVLFTQPADVCRQRQTKHNRVYEPRHVRNDRVTSGNGKPYKDVKTKGVQTTSSSSNMTQVSNQPSFERRLTADTSEYLNLEIRPNSAHKTSPYLTANTRCLHDKDRSLNDVYRSKCCLFYGQQLVYRLTTVLLMLYGTCHGRIHFIYRCAPFNLYSPCVLPSRTLTSKRCI